MVSKKLIKSYDFETIEQYFEYVLNSEINGNRSQVESLVKAMNKQQKKDCLNWIHENASGTDAEIVKNILIFSI